MKAFCTVLAVTPKRSVDDGPLGGLIPCPAQASIPHLPFGGMLRPVTLDSSIGSSPLVAVPGPEAMLIWRVEHCREVAVPSGLRLVLR